MYLVYCLLLGLGVILTAPYFLCRLRGRIFSRNDWRERFGFLPAEFSAFAQPDLPGAVWIHAVSVGETLAVAGLLQNLQNEFPDRKFFLSCVTRAGREVGEKRFPGLGHFYMPLDFRRPVQRALRRLRPALLVIVETELWPNLLRAAREYGTRVVMVNARLSTRSFRGYRWARPFMRRILENVDWIGAQTSTDAERFIGLGAKPERVVVTGNLKFDAKPPKAGTLAGRIRDGLSEAARGPVLIAASTMPGEEGLLLEAWSEIRRRLPQAILILAPRHPNRFEAVAQSLLDAGRPFVRQTAMESDPHELAARLGPPEILLLDTMGDLAGIMEIAEIVFVGGSLVPSGGHNLLEAAYWGKPILFGPHMENFRDIADLFLEGGAAVEVGTPPELARTSLELLEDEKRRGEMGGLARRMMEQGAGAMQRTLGEIRILLRAQPDEVGVGTPTQAHSRGFPPSRE